MFRATVIWLTLLLLAPAARASSLVTWRPDSIVENPHICSQNGRFCVVLREYLGVPDFGGVRADTLANFDDPNGIRFPRPPTKVIASYTDGRLVSLTTVQTFSHDVGVAESGDRFVIEDVDALFSIYSVDGSRVAALSPADILTTPDWQAFEFWKFPLTWLIRGEELVISVPASMETTTTEEIRISLADGRVLTPRHDIYPRARVWTTPAIPSRRRGAWSESPCFTEYANDPAVASVSSRQLLARATAHPLPDYPPFAQKAHLAGSVWVDLIVSESGDIICSRTNGLPFGINHAVEAAIRGWKFEPYVSDGKAMKMTSEIEFHFDVLGRAEWESVNELRN